MRTHPRLEVLRRDWFYVFFGIVNGLSALLHHLSMTTQTHDKQKGKPEAVELRAAPRGTVLPALLWVQQPRGSEDISHAAQTHLGPQLTARSWWLSSIKGKSILISTFARGGTPWRARESERTLSSNYWPYSICDTIYLHSKGQEETMALVRFLLFPFLKNPDGFLLYHQLPPRAEGVGEPILSQPTKKHFCTDILGQGTLLQLLLCSFARAGSY